MGVVEIEKAHDNAMTIPMADTKAVAMSYAKVSRLRCCLNVV